MRSRDSEVGLARPTAASVEVPTLSESREGDWGSDRIAEILRAFGLRYICHNPGSSFRGLHDSIVNHLGNRDPQMLVCLHEDHAVAIAHGYAKVTGRPLAVALHANVGLMHATMAIYNAWCDRVPMLILCGVGPVDAARRRPHIDWIHCAQDQASMIRGYVKWDDQPASIVAAEESLLRAMQLSLTAPAGPVYIGLDSELQEKAIEKTRALPRLERFRPVAAPAPGEGDLNAAVSMLKQARRPAILMGRVTRDVDSWNQRVKLAEQLGAIVATDLKTGATFPTAHPLHAGPPGISLRKEVLETLRQSDVVLSLDWIDLAGALKTIWPDASCPAKVIHASVDYQLHNGWSADHLALPEVDIHFGTTPEMLIPRLSEVLPAPQKSYEIIERSQAAPKARREVELADISSALSAATKGSSVSILRIPLGWDGALINFSHPLDQLGHSGGGGIGSGPGMAVGSALALMGTDHLPVAVLGDGDAIMGITAIWTAVHYSIPLLVIVANNRSYFNDEQHQERVARRRNRPVENKWIGQRIGDPEPDVAMMARAQGAVGFGPIRDTKDLKQKISEAVSAVRAGKVAVVDVHIGPGYAAAGAS